MQNGFFTEVYKYAPVGMIILGPDMRIIHINPYMRSCFSLPRENIKGMRFGNALGCAAVSGDGRACGSTPSCRTCRFRQSFTDALERGSRICCAAVSHAFFIGGTPAIRHLKLSASAVDTPHGRRVIISAADITQERQYERLLARELDFDVTPGPITPQNLIGVVADIARSAGPESVVSVGIASLEGLRSAGLRSGATKKEIVSRFEEIATRCTRRQDMVGRFGECALLLVFPGAGVHTAASIARRIHGTMDAVFAAQGIGGISFSAGFTAFQTPQLAGLNGDAVIGELEGCLQRAKKAGTGLFVSREFTTLLKSQP